jgi:hypothetical protein
VIPSHPPVKKRAAPKNFHQRARTICAARHHVAPGDITFSKQKTTV